jgi:hypothetical protein
MKYVTLFTLAFLLCANLTHAQTVIKPAIGVNFTDFSEDPSTGECKSKVGYQVGLTVAFGKKWYFEPGIFWLQKSTEYVDESSQLDNVKYDISGIRVPLGLGFNLLGNDKSAVGLHIIGGASAFFLTNVKNLEIDDFKKAQWGLYAGAGLDISILFLDLQYEWSLTNVQEDVSAINVGKSRSFFVNLGIRIPLGGGSSSEP